MRSLHPKLETVPPTPKKLASAFSDMISGNYFPMRTNETKLEKVLYKSRPQSATVEVEEDRVHVFGQTFVYIGNQTFEAEEGGARIAFKESPSGIYLMMRGRADFYKKTSWYNHPTLHIILLSVMMLIFLILCVFSLSVYLRKETDISQKLILGMNITAALFLLGFTLITTIKGSDLQYGIPNIFYPLFTLPIIFILLYLILLGESFRKKMFGSKRLLYLLMSGMFCIELFYWNFIGWHF